MTRGKLLSALEIAEELNTGKAAIKFLLKRFKKWLPHEMVNGMTYYLPESIKTIINILGHLETGMLPGEIDDYLDTLSNSDTNHILTPSIKAIQNEDIRLNTEGVVLLKALFNELGLQQKRIAIAHEKRAEAEERKAIAIEKRAEAEGKKAEAMNNIANALQEMNKFRSGVIEPAAQKIAHQAASALIIDEADPTAIRLDNVYDGSKTSDLFEEIDSGMPDPPDGDELTDEFFTIDELDDLSALLKNDSDSAEIEIDDLSALLDKESLESIVNEALDDLTQLITPSHALMDDLSRLIDTPVGKTPQIEVDDLSKLIDSAETVIPVIPEAGGLKETKTIEIDISPDDDIEKYKAAIMKVILELKTDGLSAEETTLMLNKNKIRTLSGKPEWSQKAISQIYKFMTSAT